MNFEDLDKIIKQGKIAKRMEKYPTIATRYNIRFITPCEHINEWHTKVFFGKNYSARRVFQVYCEECPCVYEVEVTVRKSKKTGKLRPIIFWNNWVKLEPMPDVSKFCGHSIIPVPSDYTVDKQQEQLMRKGEEL